MKANTLLEQIFLNTKDIKRLNEQIAPVYKSNVNLGALANVVDVADTNLTTDTEKAFIMDFNGNLYKFIAFNEDKTKAYIEYYANLKGEKGEQGEQGQDGQDGARGYSIHYANIDFDETITTYNLSDVSQNTPIVANDIVLFKNGYLVLIYSVAATTCETANGTAVKLENNVIPTIIIEASQMTGADTFTLTADQKTIIADKPALINMVINSVLSTIKYTYDTGNDIYYSSCAYISDLNNIVVSEIHFDILNESGTLATDTFGKDKQLYEHNITITRAGFRIYGKLTNSDPTQYNSYQAFINAIKDDYNAYNKLLDMHGLCNVSNTRYNVCGVNYEGTLLKYYYLNYDSGQTAILQFSQQIYESGTTFEDNVRPL